MIAEPQGDYINMISYPPFADVDTGIYPDTAPQYHAQSTAKRGNIITGIVVLSVDKFTYTLEQTGRHEFIWCSNIQIDSKWWNPVRMVACNSALPPNETAPKSSSSSNALIRHLGP